MRKCAKAFKRRALHRTTGIVGDSVDGSIGKLGVWKRERGCKVKGKGL